MRASVTRWPPPRVHPCLYLAVLATSVAGVNLLFLAVHGVIPQQRYNEMIDDS